VEAAMIGNNIKRFRKEKGLTQDGLARKAGIPYTTLTKLESNVVRKPSVQIVAKIARALRVSIEKLIK
jgi:transcriptional regulator with XRE-family HTH domain